MRVPELSSDSHIKTSGETIKSQDQARKSLGPTTTYERFTRVVPSTTITGTIFLLSGTTLFYVSMFSLCYPFSMGDSLEYMVQ